MQRDFINLLPTDRIRAFRLRYFMRLSTVVLFMLACLVAVNGLLLIPSYLFLSEERGLYEGELAAIDARLAASGQEAVGAELAELEAHIDRLSPLLSQTAATEVLSNILGTPRVGIVLRNLSYVPPKGQTAGKLSLSGVAGTRDALRAYVEALSALPFVSSVDLPIGAYAKERDIDFALTVQGPFTI